MTSNGALDLPEYQLMASDARIFVAFGSSSLFTTRCLDVTWAFFAAMNIEVAFSIVSKSDQLQKILSEQKDKDIFLFSEVPDVGLVNAIKQSKLKYLVFREDPKLSIEYLRGSRDNWLQSLRALTNILASLGSLHDSDCSVIVDQDMDMSYRTFLNLLISNYDMDVTSEFWDRICDILSTDKQLNLDDSLWASVSGNSENALTLSTEGFQGEDNAWIKEVFEAIYPSLRDLSRTGKMSHAIWPIQTLSLANDPEKTYSESMDMLGPARYICFGPYFHLGVGDWWANIGIHITDNRAGNQILVEVFDDDILVSQEAELPVEGFLDFDLPFFVKDHSVPIQIRVLMLEGAIDGHMSVGDITIRKGD